jgi:enamine deaminase RidA (YjgF/YER057c/UK114 family)
MTRTFQEKEDGDMGQYQKRLQELGIVLPDVPKPGARFVPAKKIGNLVFCSGHAPFKDGEFVHIGKVGKEKTLEEGYEAARLCALNCLAAIGELLGGLDKIEEIVQVRGFVNSTPDFGQQPEVINGASELLEQIFGEKGKHVRCALGTASLPRNITVEVEMIARVKE